MPNLPTNSLPLPSGGEGTSLNLHPQDTFELQMDYCDDLALVMINGKAIALQPYNPHNNPGITIKINDEAGGTGLTVGQNTLTIIGYNITGPAQFKGSLKNFSNGSSDVTYDSGLINSASNHDNRPVWYVNYQITINPRRLKVTNKESGESGESGKSGKSVVLTSQQQGDGSAVFSVYDSPVGGQIIPISAENIIPSTYHTFYIQVDHNNSNATSSMDAPSVDEVVLDSNSNSADVEFYYGDPRRDVIMTINLR